ncbi:MAG: c-type cytochrome [Thermoleophilaceae bacterium]
MRLVLAAVVVVVMGLAIAGVGMGDPPGKETAPIGRALAASKMRIAQGGRKVRRGRKAFEAEGCDACHSVAAIGAGGRLGPRMDRQTDPAANIVENIEHPRVDIRPGFPAKLMPTDFVQRMGKKEIRRVAAFVKAASG